MITIKLHYTIDGVEYTEVFEAETRPLVDAKIISFINEKGLKLRENNLWDEEI